MDAIEAARIDALAEVATAALGTPEQDAAEAALRACGTRVQEAVEWLLDSNRDAAGRLAGRLSGFWQDSGAVETGRALTQRLLTMDEGRNVASLWLVEADLAFRQADQDACRAAAVRAIELAVSARDQRTAALAWLDLSRAAYRDGDPREIERCALAARTVATGDPLVERGVLHMLAWAASTSGARNEARRRFEESLALRRRQGGKLAVAAELGNLADLAADEDDFATAARLLLEALEIALELDSAYLLVNTMPSLAAVVAESDPQAAARLFGGADALASASGLVPDPGAGETAARATVAARVSERRFSELVAEGGALVPSAAAELARASLERMVRSL